MGSGERIAIGSEALARSSRGLWVRATVEDDGVHVAWQPRYRHDGDRVLVLDANGDVEASVPAARMSYEDDTWRACGVIPYEDWWSDVAGTDGLFSFAYGVAFHAVWAIVGGCMGNPDEVVEVFADGGVLDGRFLVEDGRYLLCCPTGGLSGLDGCVLVVDSVDEGVLRGAIEVAGVEAHEVEVPMREVVLDLVLHSRLEF